MRGKQIMEDEITGIQRCAPVLYRQSPDPALMCSTCLKIVDANAAQLALNDYYDVSDLCSVR